MEALAEHAALCEASAATACLVAFRGQIVQEWKAPDHDYGPFLGLASGTKSITALLVGPLVQDGRIGSVDDPVSRYIPEWEAGADSSVTLRHLLTMTSGLGRFRPVESVLVAPAATPFVFGLPLAQTPGAQWSYSNEGVQLLSPILERAAGMPLAAYARERLFGPIGARWTRFELDEYGHTLTFGGIEGRLRDYARVAQLMLNDGRWNGERIIPSEWIAAITTPTPQNPYYGYLWWLDAESDAFWAAGDLDRIILVMPEHDLIAIRVQRILALPGTATASYFNDRGRMHADALGILKRVVPEALRIGQP